MQTNKEDITFYRSSEIGKGLPFAFVEHSELMATNDLFVPSMRDFHVIFWFKSGTGSYYLDFKEYHFEPNTIILLSKDYLHYFKSFGNDCELQSIPFEPQFIYRNDFDLKHLFHFDVGCHLDGLQILKLDQQEINHLEQISNQMKDVFHHWQQPHQHEAFYHLLSMFLLRCERIQIEDKQHQSPIDETSKVLMKFNELVEQHYRSEYKVDFYVDQLGVSLKTLSNLVKDRYRISTKSFIDERRVLEIKRQLRGTTKSIKEIAFMFEFDEPTNMVKYFKKHVGSTPKAFREQASA